MCVERRTLGNSAWLGDWLLGWTVKKRMKMRPGKRAKLPELNEKKWDNKSSEDTPWNCGEKVAVGCDAEMCGRKHLKEEKD